MSTATLDRTDADAAMSFDEIQAFLYAEARALDDRDWDTWLAFYHKDCPFWMPAWDDYDTLTEDPANEMSLMYLSQQAGHRGPGVPDQDRPVLGHLAARTAHQPQPLEHRGAAAATAAQIKLRFNWHTLTYRYGKTDQHWGTSFYTIDTSGGRPLITDKKVVLKNDHIHHVIDVYHV